MSEFEPRISRGWAGLLVVTTCVTARQGLRRPSSEHCGPARCDAGLRSPTSDHASACLHQALPAGRLAAAGERGPQKLPLVGLPSRRRR